MYELTDNILVYAYKMFSLFLDRRLLQVQIKWTGYILAVGL